MKNLLRLLLPLMVTAAAASARERLSGFCEAGNQRVLTNGVWSSLSTPIQRSYPSCTVTVYKTGTVTLASIFTAAGAAHANPFSAATDGQWFFYGNPGQYDVQFSGGGISVPFTRTFWITATNNPISVMDVKYGCKGDGVADDTACVQAALDEGTEIYFPTGIYSVTQVTMDTVWQHIYGDGKAKTVIQARGASAPLKITVGNVTVESLAVYGQTITWLPPYTTASGILCDTNGCFQSSFVDVEIAGTDIGFKTTANSYASSFERIRVTDNRIGMRFYGQVNQNRIIHSAIYENWETNLEIGDGLQGVFSFTIADSQLEIGTVAGVTMTNIECQWCYPLLLSGVYFECGSDADSRDLKTVGAAGNIISMSGVYSNASSVADHAVELTAPTKLSVESSFFAGTTGDTFDPPNLTTTDNSTYALNLKHVNYLVSGVATLANGGVFAGAQQFNNSVVSRLISSSLADPTKAQWLLTGPSTKYGKVQSGTGNQWCFATSATGDDAKGTAIQCFDDWGASIATDGTHRNPATPQAILDIRGSSTAAGGPVAERFQDIDQAVDGRVWFRRVNNATGNMEIVSAQDDGTAIQTAQSIDHASGRVGIGGATPSTVSGVALNVAGGVRPYTAGAPTCNATSDGVIYSVPATGGSGTVVYVCGCAAGPGACSAKSIGLSWP